MNLTLFHHQHRPHAYYGIMDRRNSHSGKICYYYEAVGWYNHNLAMRLLGHYRLFNLCKARQIFSYKGLSPELGYILHYGENNILSNTWVQLIPPMLRLQRPDDDKEIKSINQILLTRHSEILRNFLVASQTDFEKALIAAIDQIHNPAFLSGSPLPNLHLEIHQNNQYNTSHSKNELHIHPTIKEDAPPQQPPKAQGKEEGVFSKRQILIILDLLAKAKLIEPISLNRPNKFPAIAELLHAITGHKESSWKQALDDYRNKDLYAYQSEGGRDELIRILRNIEEKFDEAGITTVSELADQKIRQLSKNRH